LVSKKTIEIQRKFGEKIRENDQNYRELLPLLLLLINETLSVFYTSSSHSPSHFNRPTLSFPDRPSIIAGLSPLLY
jgi:hypothetical protein